jgi:hypothetical protein
MPTYVFIQTRIRLCIKSPFSATFRQQNPIYLHNGQPQGWGPTHGVTWPATSRHLSLSSKVRALIVSTGVKLRPVLCSECDRPSFTPVKTGGNIIFLSKLIFLCVISGFRRGVNEIFSGCLTLEDGSDKLPRNVGTSLPICAA